MEMKDLINDLTAAKASILTKDAEILALKASVTTLGELQASVTALTAENATLKAGDTVALKTQLSAATSFIREEADRLCVAAGTAKLAEAATLDELKASIQANRTKLQASIGGRSEPIGTSLAASPVALGVASSFSTK